MNYKRWLEHVDRCPKCQTRYNRKLSGEPKRVRYITLQDAAKLAIRMGFSHLVFENDYISTLREVATGKAYRMDVPRK